MKLKGTKQIKKQPEEPLQAVKVKKEKHIKKDPEDVEMAVAVKSVKAEKKIKQKPDLGVDDASKPVKKKDKLKKNKALAAEKAALVVAETTQSAGKKAKKAGSKIKDTVKQKTEPHLEEQVPIPIKQKKPKVKDEESPEPAKKQKTTKAIPDDEEVETSESETEDEAEDAEESSTGVAIKSEETKALPKGPEHAVFIGNLPPTINQNKVRSLFKPYGTILSLRFRTNEGGKIPRRKDMKKLKSLICYIRFSSKSEMEQACAMDGQIVEENRIRVCPQKQKQMGAINSTVFVGNISTATTDNELYEFFNGVGEIEYVRQIANKGVAFVCFKKGVSIKKALKLNQQPLNGRALRIMEVDPNRTNVKTNKKGNPVKRIRLPKSVLMRKKPGSSVDQPKAKDQEANEFHGKVVADAGAKKKKKGGFGKKNNKAKIIAQKLKAAAKVTSK